MKYLHDPVESLDDENRPPVDVPFPQYASAFFVLIMIWMNTNPPDCPMERSGCVEKTCGDQSV